MKIGDTIVLSSTGIKVTCTELMLRYEEAIVNILHKLQYASDNHSMLELESEISAQLSLSHSDIYCLPMGRGLGSCVKEALLDWKSSNPVTKTMLSRARSNMVHDHFRFTRSVYSEDGEANIEHIVSDLNSDVVNSYPVFGAAFAHLACIRLRPFVDANELLARGLIYNRLGYYYPTIWSCSISHAIKFWNTQEYFDSFCAEDTSAIETMMSLMYNAVCYAYILQECGPSAKNLMWDFIRFNSMCENIGNVESYIANVRKEIQ